MTRFLFALPLLAACAHTPCDAVWPRTCEERDGGVRASISEPERPVDASPPAADKPDHNGGKSNGGSSDSNDENGGNS